MFRSTRVLINTKYFRHNVRQLRKLSSEKQFFCPMIKANAYGHGDVELAKILVDEGVESLGVALLEEAIRLRENGILGPQILVYGPILNKNSVVLFKKYKITPVISSWPELNLFLSEAVSFKLDVHLKFNTGMSRLGFAVTDSDKLKKIFNTKASQLRITGICTHFLKGQDLCLSKSITLKQLRLFEGLRKSFQNPKMNFHVWNSASLIAAHCLDHKVLSTLGSRPGISLYGVKPEILVDTTGKEDKKLLDKWNNIELKPVMSVVSEIVQTQKLQTGDTVSYEGQFKAKKNSLIGVTPIGYADGFTRHLSGCGSMLCANQELPVTGIVCMDYTMIDLTGVSKLKTNWIGQEVVILGRQGSKFITAESLAKSSGTNTYQVFTNFSNRVPRVYL